MIFFKIEKHGNQYAIVKNFGYAYINPVVAYFQTYQEAENYLINVLLR